MLSEIIQSQKENSLMISSIWSVWSIHIPRDRKYNEGCQKLEGEEIYNGYIILACKINSANR